MRSVLPGRTRTAVNAAAVLDLLASLGSHTPALPGALCRRHRALFDREDSEGVAEAIAVCGRCPERQPCAAWAATQEDENGGESER